MPTRRRALLTLALGATSRPSLAARTSPAGDISVEGDIATFSVDYGRPLESVVWTF